MKRPKLKHSLYIINFLLKSFFLQNEHYKVFVSYVITVSKTS